MRIERSKKLQGIFAVLIMLHHLGQEVSAPWLPDEIRRPGLGVFVPIGYLLVSFFFFCSGYGLLKSLKKREGYLKGFWSRKASPILFIFLLTDLIYLLVRHLNAQLAFPVNSYSWFVNAILFLYAGFFFCYRKESRFSFLLMSLWTLLYILLCYGLVLGNWWYNAVPAFLAGIYVAGRELRKGSADVGQDCVTDGGVKQKTEAEEKTDHTTEDSADKIAVEETEENSSNLTDRKTVAIADERTGETADAITNAKTENRQRISRADGMWFAGLAIVCLLGFLLGEHPALYSAPLLSLGYGVVNALIVLFQMIAGIAFSLLFYALAVRIPPMPAKGIAAAAKIAGFYGAMTLEFYLIHGLFVQLFGPRFMGSDTTVFYIKSIPLYVLVVFACATVSAFLLRFLRDKIVELYRRAAGFRSGFAGFLRTLCILGIVFCVFTVVYSAFRHIRSAKREPDLTAYQNEYTKQIDVNGMQVSVLDKGAGDYTIVLLPEDSNPCPSLYYKPIADLLAKNYRVIVIDFPGNGFSEDTEAERTNAFFTELIRGVISQFCEGEQIILAANQLSSVYALSYLESDSDTVAGFVGIDAVVPAIGRRLLSGNFSTDAEYVWMLNRYYRRSGRLQRLLRATGFISLQTPVFEMMFNKSGMEQYYPLLEEMYVRNHLGKAHLNECCHVFENTEAVKNTVLPKELPAVFLLSEYIRKEKVYGLNWEKRYEKLISDAQCQRVEIITGDPYTIYYNPKVIADRIDLFASTLYRSSEIEEVRDAGDGRFSCSFDGVEHDFIADLPQNCEGAPYILMLHGYGESADVFRDRVHLEQKAAPAGYAVIYVTGAANPFDPTSSTGWNNGNGMEGNRDVDFLKALSAYLAETYGFDEKRCYCVGFSNGAFMTQRLAMEAQDTFAAVVSVSGMMPEKIWDERGESAKIGVFQVSGEKDDVVPKNSDGSAKYSKNPAIEDVMEYWAQANGLTDRAEESVGASSVLTKYSGADAQRQVWHLFIEGGRHAWPDPSLTKFDLSDLILSFFAENTGD